MRTYDYHIFAGLSAIAVRAALLPDAQTKRAQKKSAEPKIFAGDECRGALFLSIVDSVKTMRNDRLN